MSNRNTYNEILDKLISGSITSDERYELEKKALDDPMLFDAIEGISDVPGAHHHQHIEAIKRRLLSARRKKKIRKLLIPVAIAASIILIFSIGKILFDKEVSINDQGSMVLNESELPPIPESAKEDIVGEEGIVEETTDSQKESSEIESKAPPPEKYNQKQEQIVEEQIADVAEVSDTKEPISNEGVVDQNPEEIAVIPAVESDVVLDENEPLPKSTSSRRALSTTENINLKNTTATPFRALKVESPIVDNSLNSFVKEKYETSHGKLPPAARIELGITFNELLLVKDVRIISGDQIIGNRLIPFIKEYREWNIQQHETSKELQFIFLNG